MVGVEPFPFSVRKFKDSFLLDEVPPFRVPLIECLRERHLVGFGEREDERFQLSSGVRSWSPGEILDHLLDLMELADLYRNSLENIEESTPAVHDNRAECPSFRFKNLPSVVIVCHALALDLVPPNGTFQLF